MADYETIVGIEVHAELLTESKVFCGCRARFGSLPNTQTCPVCLGMPGVLPVLNRRALEYTIRTSLALNCEVAAWIKFDRKNYFYPDLPKNYQISQYDLPVGRNGYLDIEANGAEKRIRIRRVHLEEETGKTLHAGDDIRGAAFSLVDMNRAGIPLMEIVSEADMRSADEARAYLQKLRAVLLAIGVSDVKMEEGSMRCEANVSVRRKGETGFGALTELKNIASFKAVHRAIDYEARRHMSLLESGQTVRRETRHWDDERGESVFMRSKEEAHDYRYFPEPDLVPISIPRQWVEDIRAAMPELPDAKRKRYIRDYRLSEYDARQLADSAAVSSFFEQACSCHNDPKAVANWILGELMACLNAHGVDIQSSKITPALLGGMLRLMDSGEISGKIAKSIFEDMFITGKPAAEIVREKGLAQMSGTDEIRAIIDRVIDANPVPLQDYLAGKDKAFTFFVGQVMKETRGRANPKVTNELLREALEARKGISTL